jgi:hypothetical protein
MTNSALLSDPPWPSISGQAHDNLYVKAVQTGQETSEKISKRQQPSREQWEILKPLIQRLYIEENKTLSRVTQILRDNHSFDPMYVYPAFCNPRLTALQQKTAY